MSGGKTQYKQQVILFTRILLVIITFQILPLNTYALNDAPQTFTIDGQLFQTGGANLLLDPSVKITVQIIDPTAHCLLYEEQQTANTRDSGGYFHLNVGSATGSTKRTVNDPGRTMAQVFQNISGIAANNVPGQTCAGGIYTPSPGAVRYFRITILPSTTGVADVLSPDIVMDSVPTAVVAQSLQGLEKASILQVTNTGSTALTQGNLEALFTTPAYTNLQAILAGNFIKTDSSGAALPSYASDPAGAANGDIWFDSTTGQIKYQTSGGVQVVGAAGSGTISSLTVGSSMSLNGTVAGTISSGAGTIDLTNTGITAGTYTKLTVDAKGRATAGTVSLVEADIPNLTVAGKVSGNTITSGTISGSAGINTSGNLITTGTVSGLNVQATNLRIYNGANYVQMTAGAISSNVNLTLPVDDGNAGEVLSTDGNGILSWISSMTTSLASGKIWVGNGSNVATAVSLSGDASLANTGVLTLANTGVGAGTYTKVTVDTKGRVTSAANINSSDVTTALGYTPLNAASATLAGDVSGAFGSTSVDKIKGKSITAGSVSGQVMIYDGTQWVNSVVSGDATLAYDGILTLNKVPVSKGGTNTTSFGNNHVIVSNGTGSALTDVTCSLNQVLSFDASGNVVCANVSSLSGAILNGGNTTGADISIGSNDNKALAFKVNNATAMTISQNGYVGIGTTTPGYGLHVKQDTILFTTSSGAPYLYGAGSGKLIIGGTSSPANTLTVDGNSSIGDGFISIAAPTNGLIVQGNVGLGTPSPSTALDVSGAITAEGMSSAPSVSSSNTGRIYYDYSANKFKISQNGAAYVDLVGAGSITSIGGQTGAAQSLAISVDNSVATPTITSASDTHTWKIPMASNAGTTAGLLSKTDYDTFNNKLGTTTSFAGDVSGTYNATVVQKIQGKAVTAASVSGQIMVYNGTSWVNSVVSGAGTLDYAGNLSLNTVPVSKGGTNATSFGANRVIASNGTGSALTDITCSLNQVLSFDASGYVVCANVSAISGAILNGGNTTGADISIGTNDNKALKFKVNNSTIAMTISQSGNVGIGTITPPYLFSVNGVSQIGNTGAAYGNAYLTINRNTSPDAKDNLFLDNVEYGASKSSDIVFATGGTSRGFIIGGQDASGNGFLSLGGPSSNRSIYVNSSGYVGIGATLAPTSALDISGAITAEGMSSAPSVSGSNTGRIYYDYAANKFKVSQNGAAYVDLVSATSGFVNGGNAFGANASLGTTDNYALNIITNNTTAMTISQNGYVGVGATTPSYGLHVKKNTFYFETAGGSPYMYAAGSGNLTIGSNSSAANKLDVGGAVGIGYVGTTAPSNGLIVAGNVGVGNSSPRATLDVSGTIASKAATSNATSTIDGSTGNIQYTTASCGAFQFNNLKDGATYMFVVQGATSATCTFTAYSDAGSTALTVHMPPDNGATTASKHTIFNLTVVGTHVYVAWTPGY